MAGRTIVEKSQIAGLEMEPMRWSVGSDRVSMPRINMYSRLVWIISKVKLTMSNAMNEQN